MRLSTNNKWLNFFAVLLISAIAAASGFSETTLLAAICGGALFLIPQRRELRSSHYSDQFVAPASAMTAQPEEEVDSNSTDDKQSASEINLYRTEEFSRIKASLLAKGAILVAGEQGTGKSALAETVVQQLRAENYQVIFLAENQTTKEKLKSIANHLGVQTQNLEGKAMTVDELKVKITSYLEENPVILVIDNAHTFDARFQDWLKQLLPKKVPMLLLATDPPRRGIFINIPRIELEPLPEHAIREIMEKAAQAKGLKLTHSNFAKLQERVSGNPMLAVRAVEEEYLGLEVEGGDHHNYFDLTPFILLVGIVFVTFRFIGLGTGNKALYVFAGIGGAVLIGLSRILYNLPRESQRIRR